MVQKLIKKFKADTVIHPYSLSRIFTHEICRARKKLEYIFFLFRILKIEFQARWNKYLKLSGIHPAGFLKSNVFLMDVLEIDLHLSVLQYFC